MCGSACQALRTLAHTSAAFIASRLCPATGLPWSLARGDVSAKVGACATAGAPEDLVAQRIQRALKMGDSRHALRDGAERVGDAHWRTNVVEQGHGSAAALRRRHRHCEQAMMAQRSMTT